MYNLTIPYKNFAGAQKNGTVTFNLSIREVMRNLPQLKSVFDWMEANRNAEAKDLDVTDVSNFYTEFEDILLTAWGQLSADGERFQKSERFEFEESALFDAVMFHFVTNPTETGKLLEGVLPQEMFDLVKNADAAQIEAAATARASEVEAENARLRAELAAKSVAVDVTQ